MKISTLNLALVFSLCTSFAVLADSPSVSAVASTRLMGPALRSTDLERSIQFYTTGMGMHVVRKIEMGSVTEVILSFGGDPAQPIILLYKDSAPGKSPPIEHGNGFGRVMLRASAVSALSAQLNAAGYTTEEIRSNPANHVKIFWVQDPDGYKYEITEVIAP